MQRGDLVVVAMQGDHGKPRPALVIQSDLFDELPTVTVLPLVSSQLVPAITRVDIAASDANGLRAASQIVVHRPQTISRAKVSRVIGRADDETMLTVTRARPCSWGWHERQAGNRRCPHRRPISSSRTRFEVGYRPRSTDPRHVDPYRRVILSPS